ncbi:MAG TPA: Cys-tRNA(Pro) deacylase [Pyrinomonadaceae bacterium]|jgi:Cys-tRNA(Pro) deacylase
MSDYPITPAIRMLREKKISFTPHLYQYEEHGGTHASAQALGVPEHQVIKTIVMETESRKPLIILMHGDCEVSTKRLARLIGAKQVSPCSRETAQKQTGYMVGGTSPFGTRRSFPVYVEKSIFELPRIFINGGKRGFLLEISPQDIKRALDVSEVEVCIQRLRQLPS